jgi:hypothetical protein
MPQTPGKYAIFSDGQPAAARKVSDAIGQGAYSGAAIASCKRLASSAFR